MEQGQELRTSDLRFPKTCLLRPTTKNAITSPRITEKL